MGDNSNIEWTETTWNPTTGCTKISDGCKFCYAEKWANMQKERGIKQYNDGFTFNLAPSRLTLPQKWKKSRLIFVNSMSDLFHDRISLSYLNEVFKVMEKCEHHTFQVLTKRPENVLKMLKNYNWPKNIWLGVSVENKKTAYRLDILNQIPSRQRFVSFEPLLEDVMPLNLGSLDWVIVGGESGKNARPIQQKWVEKILFQCTNQNIPFFFKQWGKREFNPDFNDPTQKKAHKFYAKGGCSLNNQIKREFPKN